MSPFDEIADDEFGCWVDSNATVNWDTEFCTPVTDQGSCGSCWAQAAGDVATYHHYMATGSFLEVSRQQLVDCDNVSSGCSGGMEMYAFNYIASNGAAEHRDYSYTATDQNCSTSSHSTTDIL